MDEKDTHIYQDAALEIEALKKDLSKLQVENSRLKEVLVDNELQEEVPDIDCTPLEESICINGIRHIALKVEATDYDKNDIANFQIMFNILRSIRGKSPAGNKKVKAPDMAKLLKIAEVKK